MTDDIVARLRTELAKERERADAHYRVLECVSAERDALRAESDIMHMAAAKLRAERDALRELLRQWGALINYQFNGSREAMSAMTKCAQKTAQTLYGDPPWPTRIDAALKGDDRD